jgi:hypothetical protein
MDGRGPQAGTLRLTDVVCVGCSLAGKYVDVWSGESKTYSETITVAAIESHETVLLRLSPAKGGVGGVEL